MAYDDLFQNFLKDASRNIVNVTSSVSQLDDVTFLTFKTAEYTAAIFNIPQMTKYV